MIDGGLRKIYHKSIASAFWQALETGCVGAGVPDSHYIFQGGISGFIEYKRTKAFAIKFQPEQVSWIDRYTRYGGRVWVAIRQMREEGPRTAPQDNLFMVSGKQVKLLNRQGLNFLVTKVEMQRLELSSQSIIWRNADDSIMAQVWSGGTRCWNWGDIEKLLKS